MRLQALITLFLIVLKLIRVEGMKVMKVKAAAVPVLYFWGGFLLEKPQETVRHLEVSIELVLVCEGNH